MPKIKLATHLPEPPPLTNEDWKRLEEEGRLAKEAVRKATRGLESRPPSPDMIWSKILRLEKRVLELEERLSRYENT